MQFVAAKDIREGMCVAEDIRDEQGRTLVARGQRIGIHHVPRLRKFGIEAIFIDEKNGESIERPTKSELRNKCVEVLSSSFSELVKEFDSKRIALNAQAIMEVTERLVEALMASKNPLVTLLDVSTCSDHLMQHSVNVAVLATAIAIDLHIPETMLKDLAVAMLFHDIGMMFLPEALTQRPGPVCPQEAQLLRKHVQLGCDHLLRSEAVGSIAGNIVLHHHEFMDGSGYPLSVKEDKLSLMMRIANVVEVYDTVTSGRNGVPGVLPDVAISYIISHAGKHFAKEAVIALCQKVALYPNGTAVKLNTGEVGLVAGTLPKAPTRPVVLVHIDSRGHQLKEPMIVDLMHELNRSVVRSAHTIPQLLQAKEVPPRPVDPVLANLG